VVDIEQYKRMTFKEAEPSTNPGQVYLARSLWELDYIPITDSVGILLGST